MNHLRFAVSEPDEWPQACSLGARVRHTLMLFSLGCALGSASSSYAEPLPASVTSDSALLPYYFSIPAPRGQILDNDGRPLARTVTVQRLMLRVPQLENESADAFVRWVDDQWPSIANAFPKAVKPGAEDLRQHFEHRRRLPIAISDTFSIDEVS